MMRENYRDSCKTRFTQPITRKLLRMPKIEEITVLAIYSTHHPKVALLGIMGLFRAPFEELIEGC